MIRLPDRLALATRLVIIASALAVAIGVGTFNALEPRWQLTPIEIIPLGILAWLTPITVSLPLALFFAVAAGAIDQSRSGAPEPGGILLFTTLARAFAYSALVLLLNQVKRTTRSRVETSEAQLRAVGEAVPFGVWSAAPNGELLYVSQSFLDLLGRTWEQERGMGWIRAAKSPEARVKVQSWLDLAREQKPFEFEREVKGADGRRYWILTRGIPLFDSAGNVRRLTGINLDITERRHVEEVVRESEERYRFLAEAIPQIVWICNPDGLIEYFNGRWYAYSGMRRGDPIQGEFVRRMHPADRERGFRRWMDFERTADETYEAEVRLRASDGAYRWFLSRAVAQTDRVGNITHWFGTSTDIDARKRAQEQLAFLARASEAIAASLDVADTCNVLAQLAVPAIADWCGVYLLDEDGVIEPVAIAHGDAAALERAWTMERRNARTLSSPGIIAAAIRTGEVQSMAFDDPQARHDVALDETHEMMMRGLNFGASICVPMRSGTDMLGAIILINGGEERLFEPADFDLARELARRAAGGVENARAFDRERRVANALQAAFLPPRLPEVPGLRFDAVYVPGADESAIGGDWYDGFQLIDGRIVVSIGDVAGRGLPAAVVMGRVREAIRAFALQGLSPGNILAATERVLHIGDRPTMVTALVGIIDPLVHTFTFANAGHPPPLLATPDANVRSLELSGVPLGIFDEEARMERTVVLPDDALIVLYTDGLIEIDRDITGGIERLHAATALALPHAERGAQAIFQTLLGERRAGDDVAMLSIALNRLAQGPLELELPAVPESARLVRAALERFAAAHSLDDDARFALEVAVGEAVTNAIEHAYGINAGRFNIRATAESDGFAVEVHDRGHWRLPREEGRGRGVMMMKALARSVDIATDENGTRVRMSFPSSAERNGHP